ncbi:hypothetical protein KCF3NO3_32180 [Chryseobacterium sp. KCF3-3]
MRFSNKIKDQKKVCWKTQRRKMIMIYIFFSRTQENQRFSASKIGINNEFKIEGIIPDQF